MLANSSELDSTRPKLNMRRKILFSVGYLVWVSLAFFGAQVIVSLLATALSRLKVVDFSLIKESVLSSSIAFISYALALAIIIGVPWIITKQRTKLKDLGMTRLPAWSDILLGPLAYVPYIIISGLLASIAATIPGFPTNQIQDVGFSEILTRGDMVLAFLTLVVLAPIAEEAIFRGYLYTKLKGITGPIIGAVLVSICFGALHLQLNVAVDVFALSLVLCTLRQVTGSIWAGVLLHMTKNFVAFYVLFVLPLLH